MRNKMDARRRVESNKVSMTNLEKIIFLILWAKWFWTSEITQAYLRGLMS